MTRGERSPQAGQLATVVAVHDLQAEVVGATVRATDGGLVTLRVEEPRRLERPPFGIGRRMKLLYVGGPVVMRLAGRIEAIEQDKALLTIRATGPPRTGERREYIRAELVLTTKLRWIESAKTEAETAADWAVRLVDLSGSGMKLRFDEPCQVGDLLGISVKLDARPDEPLELRGRVVRLLPRDNDDGIDVAVHFEGLSPTDQDVLINLVFKVRYELLGC